MATNRIDILDSALLRPGRIDRKIEFPPPNEEVRLLLPGVSPFSFRCFYNILTLPEQARLDILKIHSRKMNLTRGINLRKIAELMPGASGAEVKVRICCMLHTSFLSDSQTLTNTGVVWSVCQGVCTEAGMYALRERRVHVTQEDFEMAVAKVCVHLWPFYLYVLSC